MTRRPASFSAVSAAALAIAAGCVAQPCPEPSALDVDPAVAPLTVVVSPGGQLHIAWEPVSALSYRTWRGTLTSLAGPMPYDHVEIADEAPAELFLDQIPGDSYFLVQSLCAAGPGSTGRDSNVVERPPAGTAVVTLALEGGAGVFAAQVWLDHPPATTYIAPEEVWWLGPFAEGAPGAPLVTTGTEPPGFVTSAALFAVFNPDPSFDPPVGVSVDVVQLTFSHFGATPLPSDFTLTDCEARDDFGSVIPETTCLITSVVLTP